jgi:hypothetical protein
MASRIKPDPTEEAEGVQMTELSSAVQRAFMSAGFHGGVWIFKTKNQIKTKS